jgi:phage shock protein A
MFMDPHLPVMNDVQAWRQKMFRTFKTLIVGANARAEERVRDIYSIELIDQKIREATAGLKSAKVGLAGIIQRKRTEARQIEQLEERVADLESRAREAIAQERDDLAGEAARAIAAMENELTVRRSTLAGLEARHVRLEGSVSAAHRRLEDLKQGAMAARALRKEQDLQVRLGHTGDGMGGAMEEAEDLIKRVMGADDPFERSEILSEIDRGLGHEDVAGRMAEAGIGSATQSTASDVLARLKAK